jgi:hypothetical protein
MSLMAFFDPFGTVPGSSLNWSQHALLQKAASGSRPAASGSRPSGPTIDTGRICRELESVGQKIEDVVRAIDWLVADLDLRLETQAELLNRQVDLLADIARTLHNPARTRAAERLVDAAELLRHHRNERALSLAEQAADDDPNNDTAFVLAAWAALGLEDLERARGYFREAAQATASEQGAEKRHMNAVYLAARLTFALDGPEAALRELDAAEPFIDPALPREHPTLAMEQFCLLCLSPNKAAAIKFDRAAYYTAANQMDAALETFREIAEEYNGRFCLMALTDPVLANNDAVVNAARETLRIHNALIDEISKVLPLSEARWRALQTELQQHRIKNAKTAAAVARFDELFTPTAGKRTTLDETWPWPPNRRWLEDFSATLKDFNDFDEEMRLLIERERMREAALEAGVQDFLREYRKYRLVDRGRTEAVVGYHAMIGGYDFKHITVDGNGKITVKDHSGSAPYLIRKFKAGGRS